MEFKNKTDEEIVKSSRDSSLDPVNANRAQLEMMYRLKKSTDRSTWIVGILTVLLIVLTAVLIWQGYILIGKN